MTQQSVHVRGFGVTVEVPDRVGAAVRKLVRRPGRDRETAPPPAVPKLEFKPVPAVAVDWRERELASTRDFVSTVAPQFAAEAAEKDEISGHPWYHTIELPDGVVTPGRFDHRELASRYGLPDDLTGKRALDVGSGDGFWAFALERLGADVTSVDIETFADTDLPRALHQIYVDHPLNLSFRAGLDIARRRLGSHVKLVDRPVYEIDPVDMGTFDFVHAGDILLHLRDPALALQRIRSVTSGEALIVDLYDPVLDEIGGGRNLTLYRGGWFDTHWWTPALSTLVQMVADAGFREVEVVSNYRLSDVDGVPGPWRAAIRARV